MAKCGCAGNTCSCALTGGRNVQVTGTGSSTNPYVINATTTVLAGSSNVNVTGSGTATDPYVVAVPDVARSVLVGGANVTVTGTGTAGNPYVISSTGGGGGGTVLLGGSNVLITGTGTSGDPYVVNATGTIAVADTVINAGTGITVTGVGTSASPYVITATGGGGTETAAGVFVIWQSGSSYPYASLADAQAAGLKNSETLMFIGPETPPAWAATHTKGVLHVRAVSVG